jgi:hypothetical protein
MDELEASEARVARAVVGAVRPRRAVDVVPIVRAATSTSPRRSARPASGAAALAVAASIAVLAGGLSLAIQPPGRWVGASAPATDPGRIAFVDPTDRHAPLDGGGDARRIHVIDGDGVASQVVDLPGTRWLRVHGALPDDVRDDRFVGPAVRRDADRLHVPYGGRSSPIYLVT